MATSNLLISDRIANAAVGTFVSEVTKNLPGNADYLVRKQVKNDAWGVVVSRHPVTNEWRDAWQAYMRACNGVKGLKTYSKPMPPKALLWRSVVAASGGAMNKVYREANGRVVTPTVTTGTDVAAPYVQGRNAATINRVTRLLQNWVYDNDILPTAAVLGYFTAYEAALWDIAITSLRDKGYVLTSVVGGYEVTQRPSTVTNDEVSEYIKALSPQDRLELVSQLLSS